MKKALSQIIIFMLVVAAVFGLTSCGTSYKVIFENEGETYQTLEIKEGETITEPNAPQKNGFDFLGWYNNGTKWRFDFNTVNENLLLEAKWRINLKKMFSSYSGLGIDLANDGSYLELDTNPYNLDDFYLSTILTKIEETNKKLGFSESLYQKMISTNALQGRQTAENEFVTVEWTYHPDNGLHVIYEIKK